MPRALALGRVSTQSTKPKPGYQTHKYNQNNISLVVIFKPKKNIAHSHGSKLNRGTRQRGRGHSPPNASKQCFLQKPNNEMTEKWCLGGGGGLKTKVMMLVRRVVHTKRKIGRWWLRWWY